MFTHYHKILIPLDGSPLAEHVLDHIGWLAAPAQTELCLVSVIESWRYAAAGPEFPLTDLITPVRNEMQAYLQAQQAKLQAAGYAVVTHVIEGDAAGVILNLVQTAGIDLVAMSSHGRSGFVRWALGSVAERVIHGARIPVFLVRETTKPRQDKPQTILLPLDGSATAEQALPEAQALALANQAQILLVQVIQKLDEGSQRLLFKDETAAKATFAEWRRQAEAYLAGVAARVTAAGVACDYRVMVDDPDRAICAMSNHADLIVMGTHGRSGLARWVYGSVANKVLRGASCPLLLVHTMEQA
ncbi:MAG: universal stress protein [Caldilinea sp. CFX5]|nr:universal stress protein [Caldilinea sp. CFX5]